MSPRRSVAIALTSTIALSAAITATAASGAAPAAQVQPRVVTGASALAFVKTIPVGTTSDGGIAVDLADDSVYVSVASSPNALTIIDGRTGMVARSVALGTGGPRGVAVNQEDDTVYVALFTSGRVSVINGRNTDDSVLSASVGDPRLVAVNQVDDTVYVTQQNSSGVAIINGRTNAVSSVPLSPSTNKSVGVGVNNRDDTVYVTLENGNTGPHLLSILKGGNVDDSQTRPVVARPWGVAVQQRDDTVYIGSNQATRQVSVLNGKTGAVDDTLNFPSSFGSPWFVGVSNIDDTVYVSANGSGGLAVLDGANLDDSYVITPSATYLGSLGLAIDDTGGSVTGAIYVPRNTAVQVVTLVTPTLGTTLGAAGDPVSISATAPHVLYSPDSATVQAVTFGGVAGTSLTAGTPGNWTVTAPAGSGSVPVIVTLNGGQQVNVGTFTYSSSPNPPAPTPVYPPGAPTDVKAAAGSGEATVSWTAPTYIGSYPITDYEVTSSPGSHTCLVKAPASTCTVTGLANGTSYTFTVRALNGAGWGVYSEPSNAVIPASPSILITGSRDANDDRYVKARGTTTDLAGKQVVPYVRFPGQSSATAGTGVRTVSADGTFTWQRKTGKKVYVYFEHAEARSNTIVIPAR